ncbi:unnamed protein product [Caretta caretta]
MPEAYDAARDLLVFVPVSLVVQKGFQAVLATVIPTSDLQEHVVPMPLLVPRRLGHSRGKPSLISLGTVISRFGLPVSCPHRFYSTVVTELSLIIRFRRGSFVSHIRWEAYPSSGDSSGFRTPGKGCGSQGAGELRAAIMDGRSFAFSLKKKLWD